MSKEGKKQRIKTPATDAAASVPRPSIVGITSRDELALEFAKSLVNGYASGGRQADVSQVAAAAYAMADTMIAAAEQAQEG